MYLHHFHSPEVAAGLVGGLLQLSYEFKKEQDSWTEDQWDEYNWRQTKSTTQCHAKDNGRHRNDPCPCSSGRKFKRCCYQYPMSFLSDRS